MPSPQRQAQLAPTRATSPTGVTLLRFRDRTVDLQTGVIHHNDGREERLTTREVCLLGLLEAAKGRVVKREEAYAKVWAYSSKTSSRACDVAVARLRKKLESKPAHPIYLLTEAGEGYRLVPQRSKPARQARAHQTAGELLQTALAQIHSLLAPHGSIIYVRNTDGAPAVTVSEAIGRSAVTGRSNHHPRGAPAPAMSVRAEARGGPGIPDRAGANSARRERHTRSSTNRRRAQRYIESLPSEHRGCDSAELRVREKQNAGTPPYGAGCELVVRLRLPSGRELGSLVAWTHEDRGIPAPIRAAIACLASALVSTRGPELARQLTTDENLAGPPTSPVVEEVIL